MAWGTWMKPGKKTKYILLSALLAAGILLFLYPFVSDFVNAGRQRERIRDYEARVHTSEKGGFDELWQAAEAYNQALAKTGIRWDLTEEEKEEADSYLNTGEDGCIGYLEIPKIDVALPIYHGTSADALRRGVGHIEGTSLPVGGESTHTVLTGHRGLPSSRLLLHLDRLQEGDTFAIAVLGKKLDYSVDQILTVDPTDVSSITIEDGKDLCTIVTCTPYGLNTQRLLVRGHRTDSQSSPQDSGSEG